MFGRRQMRSGKPPSAPCARHTALTNLFSGGPARGIINRIMHELGPMNPAAPAFPLASGAMASLHARAEAGGSGDFSPLWSGQIPPAARKSRQPGSQRN